MNVEGASMGANRPTTVVLMIREELLGTALLEILGRNSRFRPLLASNSDEAFRLAEQEDSSVIIFDLKAPHLAELKLPPEIRKLNCALVLCDWPDANLFSRLFKAGIKGCISREDSVEILQEAIAELLAGRTYFPAAFLDSARNPPLTTAVPLTGREQEIIAGVVRGCTSRMIAAELRVGERSVETYRYRLMKKLGVKNAAALVDYAIRNGWDAAAGSTGKTL